MKKFTILLFAVIGMLGTVAGQGIHFEKKSWKEILELSSKIDKPIFVDVYTTWCGPCKKVAKTVFTQAKVGDLYNKNFLNAKIDGESKEGIEFVKKYKIKSYPSFLYLDKNGKVLYKFIGAKKADKFIEAIDEIKIAYKYGGWETMDSIYQSGKGDPNLFYDYYTLMTGKKRELALNAYLDNLSEDELMNIEIGTVIDEISIYSDTLMNKIVDGLIPRCGLNKDYDFRVTFAVQICLNNFLKEAINRGNLERFNQVLRIKNKFYDSQDKMKLDPDITLSNGRGLFFVSPEICELFYAVRNSNRDDEFVDLFEDYITKFMENSTPIYRYSERDPKKIFLNEIMLSHFMSTLHKQMTMLSKNLLMMIDHYWLLSDSNKSVKKNCYEWVMYVYNLNPYNYHNIITISDLLTEMGYKKDGLKVLKECLSLQSKIENEKNKDVVKLKRRLNKRL